MVEKISLTMTMRCASLMVFTEGYLFAVDFCIGEISFTDADAGELTVKQYL
jgi:hypothetical protein